MGLQNQNKVGPKKVAITMIFWIYGYILGAFSRFSGALFGGQNDLYPHGGGRTGNRALNRRLEAESEAAKVRRKFGNSNKMPNISSIKIFSSFWILG